MLEPAPADGASVRVALVAAYPAVRAGLRALLAAESQTSEPRIEIVAESASLHDLPPGDRAAIDVAVVDLDGERFWGTPADLADLPPGLGLVLLGPDAAESRLPETLGDRPWAYLLKEAGGPELARAVEAVAAGLVVIQPPLTRRLLSPAPSVILDGSEYESLTPREQEVLELVAQGLPNKTIARRLGISEHTVKFHLTSILSKLDASSRTEAVRLAARRGLIVL